MISDPETKHEIVVRRIEAADSINCRFHYSLRLINRVKYSTALTLLRLCSS